jgi:hypothetical protein
MNGGASAWIWFAVRIFSVAGVLWPDDSSSMMISWTDGLAIIAFGFLLALAGGAYVHSVDNFSFEKSILSLFIYSPLWPIRKSACSIVILLGIMIFSAGLTEAIASQSLQPISFCAVGILLIAVSLLSISLKRNKVPA